MKAIEYLERLSATAKVHAEEGIADSVRRDRHMNGGSGEELLEPDARAVVVAFINRVARSMGVDYGLYTCDLPQKARPRPVLGGDGTHSKV